MYQELNVQLLLLARTYYCTRLEASIHGQVLVDFPYKELVGALISIMVCTRPDIAFTVSCLTAYFSSSRAIHLRNLQATSTFGLILGKGG